MRDISFVAEFPACVITDLVLFFGIATVAQLQFLFCSSHLKFEEYALDGQSAFSVLFLINLIFFNQLAIDFIYILLNTVPSDIETMHSFHLLTTDVEA